MLYVIRSTFSHKHICITVVIHMKPDAESHCCQCNALSLALLFMWVTREAQGMNNGYCRDCCGQVFLLEFRGEI